MQNQQVVPFVYEESLIRTVTLDSNEPGFYAMDVAKILEHSDTNKMVQGLDDDEYLIRTFFVSGQHREIIILTESGLYTVLIRSNKPQAKPFRRWVTHEVIPQIRKTGGYNISLHERLDAQDKKLNLIIHHSMSMSKKQRKSGFKLPEHKVPIKSDAEQEYYKELIKDAIKAAIQSGLPPSKKVMKNRKKHLKQLKDDEFDSLIDDMLENHQIKPGRNKRVMLYFLD